MDPGETACTHCGLPAPATGGEASFCCHGCRAAYELMHSCGLERYYDLRERLGDGGEVRPVQALPSSDAYAHFDDPGFLEDHGQAAGRAELRVSGLHCAACVWVIDRLPHVVDGVHTAAVNLATGRLQLEWNPDRVALSQIATFLHRLGYPTHAADADAGAAARSIRRSELIRLAVAGAVAGNIMLLSFALYAGASGGMGASDERLFEWASLVLAFPAVSYCAWPFLRGALAGLRVRRLHMDLPISLGILAGFLASAWAVVTGTGEVYFDSVAALVFLLLVGRWIQRRGQERALSRTTLLHMLLPGTGRRRADHGWETVPATRLQVGDEVWVRVGEAFPADGRVVEGRTSMDLSSLTGESRPVPAGEGSPAFAGTRNLDADVHVCVEAVGSSTRVGSLAEHVDRARGERAPIVALADRIAGWFVAAVLTLAVIGGVAWWFVDPSRCFDVVVSLLVVSCPCALGLATPAALSIARARAAERGVLIGSPAVLERLASVRHVVLDKTGTLTCGRMSVVDGPDLDSAVLRGIVALESRARHPAAEALREWAGRGGVRARDSAVEDFVEWPGRGVEGVVDGLRLRIGSVAWLASPDENRQDVAASLARGDTPVVVEVEGETAAVVAVGDALRDEAAAAVSRLQAMGYELSLCSGDHDVIVDAVAETLGIERAVGQATPEQKAALVAELGDVAMVGDGINDAPALRAARVGIAVGGGAEAAMHVADVYLGRPGTEAMVELMDGARRTMGIVRRNLGFSLTYNVIFASLALAGLISPLLAAILMPLSSLTVLGLSMLGRSFDGPRALVGEDDVALEHVGARERRTEARTQPAH